MDITIAINILYLTVSIFLIFLMAIFTVMTTMVIYILRSMYGAVGMAQKELRTILEDIKYIRSTIKRDGIIVALIMVFLNSFFKK